MGCSESQIIGFGNGWTDGTLGGGPGHHCIVPYPRQVVCCEGYLWRVTVALGMHIPSIGVDVWATTTK